MEVQKNGTIEFCKDSSGNVIGIHISGTKRQQKMIYRAFGKDIMDALSDPHVLITNSFSVRRKRIDTA